MTTARATKTAAANASTTGASASGSETVPAGAVPGSAGTAPVGSVPVSVADSLATTAGAVADRSEDGRDPREALPSGVTGVAATERLADPRPVLAWIMAAIAAWGVVLAGGVVLYDYRAGALNLWKPLTIVVCVAGFLGLFRWTMARSARRTPHTSPLSSGDVATPSGNR